MQRFLNIEDSSGLLLGTAALVALVWANSPWSGAYHALWATELSVDLAGQVITDDLLHWINDGLMTLFFFVLGLEITHELTTGQLATRRSAAVPAAGAVGGMLVPALIFLAFNLGGTGVDGWGIPMATDVAFALGVLALLGNRVPPELKVLLLALAIVDDIGAIIVIAAFYSDGLDGRWAGLAVAGLLVAAAAQRAGVRFLPVYIALGTGIWLATFESGIHATIAGVALGLLTPARPLLPKPTPNGSPTSSPSTPTSPPPKSERSRSASANRFLSPNDCNISCTRGPATSSSPSSPLLMPGHR